MMAFTRASESRVLLAGGMCTASGCLRLLELFLPHAKEVFIAHQGFDEVGLPVACKDIDYAIEAFAPRD